MFSVITPTFNRQHTLHRVYESLQNQTCKEFHWIIIDDASSDNTENLVNKYIAENLFEIEYHKLKENKGKPFALNFGFSYCRENITVIADSDDSFAPETLMDLKNIWNEIDNTINGSKIGSVWTLVKDENDVIVGDKFPKNFWQVNFNERVLNQKTQIAGEKWHSWRTAVLRKYKMCYNENSFIGESATWYRINTDFDFLCLNICHRTYFDSEDGMINQKKSKLKIAKIKYYTAYFQLKNTAAKNVIGIRYFRYLAFDYIKASFLYSDREISLRSYKWIACLIAFLSVLPRRILSKL